MKDVWILGMRKLTHETDWILGGMKEIKMFPDMPLTNDTRYHENQKKVQK